MSKSRDKMIRATRLILDSLNTNLELSKKIRDSIDIDEDLSYKVSMATRVKVLEKLSAVINKLQNDDWQGALEMMKPIHKQIALSLNQIKRLERLKYSENEKYYRDTLSIIYLQIKVLKKYNVNIKWKK